jgi:hypothetical protein
MTNYLDLDVFRFICLLSSSEEQDNVVNALLASDQRLKHAMHERIRSLLSLHPKDLKKRASLSLHPDKYVRKTISSPSEHFIVQLCEQRQCKCH